MNGKYAHEVGRLQRMMERVKDELFADAACAPVRVRRRMPTDLSLVRPRLSQIPSWRQ